MAVHDAARVVLFVGPLLHIEHRERREVGRQLVGRAEVQIDVLHPAALLAQHRLAHRVVLRVARRERAQKEEAAGTGEGGESRRELPAASRAEQVVHVAGEGDVEAAGLDVEYVAGDAASLADAAAQAGRFDSAFAGNVYHLLSPGGRREFAAGLAILVRPGGLLFLSTLSPRDPQHYAVGEPVLGEVRSWVEHVYLHFCTADELTADFSAFTVLDLEERSYDEHNANGVVHRHASWFLEGRRR